MIRYRNTLRPSLKRDRSRRAVRKQRGGFRETYLAVVNNSIKGTRPGYLWVHDLAGADENGDATYGPVYQLPRDTNAIIQLRPNWKVEVISKNGVEYISGMAFGELERIGYDPHQTNPLDPSLQFKLIEHLQNLQSFPNGDATVRVMPGIYRKSDGTYDVFAAIDIDILTGFLPALEDDQVVVCLWLDEATNTITVTGSTEISQDTNLKLDPVAAMTYINECADAAPPGAIGIWSYIIFGDDTTITAKNKFHDLRGIVGAGGGGSGGDGPLDITTTTIRHNTRTLVFEDTTGTAAITSTGSVNTATNSGYQITSAWGRFYFNGINLDSYSDFDIEMELLITTTNLLEVYLFANSNLSSQAAVYIRFDNRGSAGNVDQIGTTTGAAANNGTQTVLTSRGVINRNDIRIPFDTRATVRISVRNRTYISTYFLNEEGEPYQRIGAYTTTYQSTGAGQNLLAIKNNTNTSTIEVRNIRLYTVGSFTQEVVTGVTGAPNFAYSDDNTSNPPTKAQLTTAFGDPTTLTDGYLGVLDDNGAGTNVYLVGVSNDEFWYTALTKAT